MNTAERVFGFSDYKEFLKMRLGQDGQRTGRRKALAEFLGIQTAFVSQVLNGHVNFSLEQAERINRFLQHSSAEAHFFLLLLQRHRAGTKELSDYFTKLINAEREKHQQVQARLQNANEVGPEQRTHYYSHWLYSAIHIALSIPYLQNPEQMAHHFSVPLSQVEEYLAFLTSSGLAVFSEGRYHLGTHRIHLGHDVKDIRNHHTNWRMKGIDQLHRRRDEDLQYSVVYSCSRETGARIKEKFLAIIKENIDAITPSKEEALFCNVIDFFEL